MLGWNVSGVVEEIGFGVADFRLGDEVFVRSAVPTAASAAVCALRSARTSRIGVSAPADVQTS
ncbi:hypothetical protein WCD74_22185 [Actinomycetospora sp. OC33-EN08]|uniref:Uncharacterized protein n=1 Tax=Actinomycetospora aurantiaca TaxID=3129233 RepID=A0ABU8MU67_9PSEU